MGFMLSAKVVTLALWSLTFTNLSLGAPAPQDPCAALSKYIDQGAPYVPGKDAYACLLSPPFNQTRAANTHREIRKMAHFLSSQAFFNDPKGLPLIVDRVDLNGTFDSIKKKIDGKAYKNDYEFHRDLTELFGGYHDGHTKYYSACSLGFGPFKHSYPLVSIVPPGEYTPRIYLADPDTGEVGEEIVEIAGERALDHLLKLVKVLKGPTDAAWIDADTRWNGLFIGRYANGILPGKFAARDLYPGPDFKMKTASGKVLNVGWYVDGPGKSAPEGWKRLVKGTDSFIALCLPPPPTATQSGPSGQPEPTGDKGNEGFSEEAVDKGVIDEKNAKSSGTHRYATPDFGYLDFITKGEKRSELSVRHDLDVSLRKALGARADGNTIKNYSALHLPDTPPVAYPPVTTRLNGSEQTLHFLKAYPDVAVWGIHGFMPTGTSESPTPDDSELFFYYWRDYMIRNLQLLKKKGVKRLILDMSNNGGGIINLGLESVRRFFPEADPYYGIDFRRSPFVDFVIKSEDMVTGLKQVNGKPFASADDFLNPPVAKRGDYFSKIGRFNQISFMQQSLPGVEFTTKGSPPFSVENFVILTDGQCGSTCAITVEALVGIGLASVVVGGQPCASGNKTMQYVGGIKGYQVLSASDLSIGPDHPSYNMTTTPNLAPYVPRPLDFKFEASFNFRNSYTPNDSVIPQEFIFQPADGHLWYTKQMITDRTILWNDVVKKTWDDKGVNKLLKARQGVNKPKNKGSILQGSGSQYPKQPPAGYIGQRTRETLKLGVLADLKYLASGWLGGWGGKD